MNFGGNKSHLEVIKSFIQKGIESCACRMNVYPWIMCASLMWIALLFPKLSKLVDGKGTIRCEEESTHFTMNVTSISIEHTHGHWITWHTITTMEPLYYGHHGTTYVMSKKRTLFWKLSHP